MSTLELPDQLNVATVLVDSHIAAGRSDKPAILCGDRRVTYADLQEGVNRLGNALKSLDVRMEERVALLLPDCPEWAFAFFGAMKIGAVALPLNTTLTPADYEYELNDSRTRVLIVDASLLERLEPIREKLRYLEHVLVAGVPDAGSSWPGTVPLADIMQTSSPELTAAETSKDDAAFWLYSSGTTGAPKGTIHLHHDMLVEAVYYAQQTIGLRESDISYSVSKLFFAYGLGNGLYFPLSVGGTTILFPGKPSPDAVFDILDRYQPTVFYSVPTSYAALLQRAEETRRTDLGRVRMCVSAGEPLPKPVYDRWRERFGLEILDGIGSTEILHIYISNRPGQSRGGSTGQLVPGYEYRIVDDQGKDLPPGEVGTLLIKGDSIAAGYWNKHEKTKETFLGEWINTRDKFRVDTDGFFWYMGRADDMMKVGGQAVWPSEVEHVLQQHPAVLESGVCGTPDEHGLIKPRAFVVLKNGQQPSEKLARELQEFVRQRTAPYKYPRSVFFVDDLPKTASGKIKRYQLRQMASEKLRSGEPDSRV
ncbi:MAG TPA: benzoate-CoA ligase family protein [Planctomycetaceae bacterium]|nr:benzoate-CoA ligase family protein [Planctomycetaceae bacterium]